MNKGIIIGGIAIGLYLLSKKKDETKKIEQPVLKFLNPFNNSTTNTKIAPGVTTRAPAVAPVKPVNTNTNTLANRWVFVDSTGGEGIYAGVSSSKSVISGYGKDKIMTLSNNVELGVATGVIQNGMIEVRVTINGKWYKFFADSTQVRIMDDAQRNFFVNTAKTGRKKTTQELNTIIDFFRK